jgi:hypothetical protein
MLRYFVTIFFVITVTVSFAQKKKKAKKSESSTTGQASSLAPYYPQKNYEPKKKKASGKVTYDATENFYKRREELAKQERKNEKEMAKPENSDPLYFGHKRPPKKRPPGKMKYCKVCGLRH